MSNKRKKRRPVSPEAYDSHYFCHECGGHELYRESGGKTLDERLSVVFQTADIRPGMRVLDLGCGRGELLRKAADAGAFSVGIDYSIHALDVSKKTCADLPSEKTALFAGADATRLPFQNSRFHRVLLSDIMEHLIPEELEAALEETHRVLKPEGRVVFHTFPNRWFYQYYYPVRRLLYDLPRGKAGPRNPRTHYERLMHVNELSPPGLIRVMRPFFDVRIRCAHRSRWDPAGRSFLKGNALRDWFTQPEIWGTGVKK